MSWGYVRLADCVGGLTHTRAHTATPKLMTDTVRLPAPRRTILAPLPATAM